MHSFTTLLPCFHWKSGNYSLCPQIWSNSILLYTIYTKIHWYSLYHWFSFVRELCERVVPGNRVTVIGVYSIKKAGAVSKVSYPHVILAGVCWPNIQEGKHLVAMVILFMSVHVMSCRVSTHEGSIFVKIHACVYSIGQLIYPPSVIITNKVLCTINFHWGEILYSSCIWEEMYLFSISCVCPLLVDAWMKWKVVVRCKIASQISIDRWSFVCHSYG